MLRVGLGVSTANDQDADVTSERRIAGGRYEWDVPLTSRRIRSDIQMMPPGNQYF